jgi:hypothetical protein
MIQYVSAVSSNNNYRVTSTIVTVGQGVGLGSLKKDTETKMMSGEFRFRSSRKVKQDDIGRIRAEFRSSSGVWWCKSGSIVFE